MTPPTRRSSSWIGPYFLMVFVTGCTGGYDMTPETTSKVAEARKNCAALNDDPELASIRGKIVLDRNSVPTKAMVSDTQRPTSEQREAVRKLQEIQKTCERMLESAGYVSSATEDILNKKTARLRYGLYKGDLSFGAFNLGIVKIELQNASYEKEKNEAYRRGEEIGAQMDAALITQMQLNSIQSTLNRFQYSYPTTKTYWNCSIHSPQVGNTVYASCY